MNLIHQDYMKIVSIGIIVILLVGLVNFYFFTEEPKKDHEEDTVEDAVIDDQISLLTNQGLTIEILRIRHRDILDKIFKISYTFKDPPSSYWITIVDGKECNSSGNVGFGSSGYFNEWDNMLKDCRVNYKVKDERKKSDVIIKIIEHKIIGLFGFRFQDIIEEEIHLTYDYRIGRWDGDDYLKDNDGYGHYLGEYVEVWFDMYQSDYDHDGIPYWTEINILDTDPMVDDSELDPDNDGIPTSWEWKWGYDPYIWDDHKNLDPDIDGIENLEEYKMRKWFSNPYQPDIYIETDGMQKKNFLDLTHVFHKDSQQMIIERFAQHGINVYIDDGWPDGPVNGGGEMLPFIDEIDEVIGGQILSFYQHNFPDERKGIFRYIVIANKLGWNTPSKYNKYDTILVFSGRDTEIKKKIAVKTLYFLTPRLRSILLAKGVLHELGHSMGLLPYTFPGNDIQNPIGFRYPSMPEEEYEKYLVQYHSIMNYDYIYKDGRLFDYSDGSNGPPYDQDDWKHLFLPSFQSDARAYEEPTDENFEDFEVMIDEIYPKINGWTYYKNLTQKQNDSLKYLVFSDLPIDIDFLILTSNNTELERNARIYALPDIDPFPVIQSWSLVAEGKIDIKYNEIKFYSIDEKISEIMDKLD